jgi:hypothetical protein
LPAYTSAITSAITFALVSRFQVLDFRRFEFVTIGRLPYLKIKSYCVLNRTSLGEIQIPAPFPSACDRYTAPPASGEYVLTP